MLVFVITVAEAMVGESKETVLNYVYEHHKDGLYVTPVVIFLACVSQNNHFQNIWIKRVILKCGAIYAKLSHMWCINY